MEKFEQYLESRLKRKEASFPPTLYSSIRYSVFSGGKRIRPRLIFATGHALGLTDDKLFPLAALIELIHTYTLIHDDLPALDDDDFRRGKPTNHKLFGEATALLAGDALTPLAIEEVFNLPLSDALRLVILHASLAAIDGAALIGGQVAEFELTDASSVPHLESIFARKTGALFAACLELPALAAETPPAHAKTLKKIGEGFGILFQIADDLEDDWDDKKLDLAHLASVLTKAAALERARAYLASVRGDLGTLPEKLTHALTPFVEEIAKKCESAT